MYNIIIPGVIINYIDVDYSGTKEVGDSPSFTTHKYKTLSDNLGADYIKISPPFFYIDCHVTVPESRVDQIHSFFEERLKEQIVYLLYKNPKATIVTVSMSQVHKDRHKHGDVVTVTQYFAISCYEKETTILVSERIAQIKAPYDFEENFVATGNKNND